MGTELRSPDYTAADNERCGICTDIVVDRGVLDCCDHWFCFACIDNWATITNLCPLCKNEFQLITCLPVYDTIGNIKSEDYSLSRDDDWCIQGENNTLSFPSYYIEEDAVICLDGDGCKMRNGFSIAEEDLPFDTSIACDSCDIWYHAFCVGFNPEYGTSESSWLCPRCLADEALQKSDEVASQNLANYSAVTADLSFSSKVSVSVADAGETAVVISMVEGQQKPEYAMTSVSEVGLDCNADEETEAFHFDTSSGNAELDERPENSGCTDLICNSLLCSDEKNSKTNAPENDKNSESLLDIPEVCLKEKMLELPSLKDTKSESSVIQSDNDVLKASLTVSAAKSVSSPSCCSADGDLKAGNADGMISKPSSHEDVKIPSVLSCGTFETKNEISGSKSDGMISTSSVDELIGGDIKYQVPGSSSTASSERIESVDKTNVNSGEDMTDILPKHDKLSVLAGDSMEKQPHVKDDGCLKTHSRKREMHTKYPAKKTKSDGKSQLLSSRDQASAYVFANSKTCSRNAADNNDNMLSSALSKKAGSPDIMSIVQEVDHQPNDHPADTNAVDKSTMRRENSSGPRMKKIMRRVGEKEESSSLVQKLSKEIREAVLDKTSNNNDKNNDFDVKLLTAFRAAIVKPKDELADKNVLPGRSLKKSLLQKGKTRENLTKKIYGTSTGRRKRAWDRDWEVEFWKHRCTRAKSEKVETLHSVLELLKKATNSCSNDSPTDEGPEGESNSILSRVYLADTSVFPRKDDIKPLSVLAGSSQTVNEVNMAKTPTGISRCFPQVRAVSSDDTGKRSTTLRCIAETSCRKEKSHSDSSGSKGRVQFSSKELSSQSDSSKIDKKKWALEVLARKNASINSSGSKGQEDKSALKGNYPLLAQLPVDMRPVPASSSHNKVSLSVRQAQLYRITEHYLRRTNLPIMRRTADTELAVADAVNIEKGIFEKSNSKLVYINLCSQALSQRSNKPPSAEPIASNSSAATAEDNDQITKETSLGPSVGGCSKVEEALKLAGLSSDSPPNSPCRPTIEDLHLEDNPNGNTRDQGLENVLDMDFHPELDIYGDFEYDLTDEGYEVSKLLQQQNRDSKLKVVLSTLGRDEPVNLQNSKPQDYVTEVLVDDQDDFKVRIEDSAENRKEEIKKAPSLSPKPSEEEMYEEPSLSEYEELYGPDNILFANKMPEELIGQKRKSMEMVAAAESIIHRESEKHQSQDGSTTSEFENEGCAEHSFASGRASLNHGSSAQENSPAHSLASENSLMETKAKLTSTKFPDPNNSIFKKVEAYVKEHIRPLCKSGIITVGQYRWAVGKTRDKVMKFHHKAKNANFLIKEGEKVKRLAEQYVEAAQQQKDS